MQGLFVSIEVMPLTAVIQSSGERVCSLDFDSAHQIRSTISQKDLVCACHDCAIPVFPRERQGFRLHFVHSSPCATKMGSHPESIEHLEGKRLIREFLIKQLAPHSTVDVHLEFQLPNAGKHGRIADVAVLYPSGWLEIHEIQLAPITTSELEARTNDYRELGADVFWWLGKSANTAANRNWCISEAGSVYQLFFDPSCTDRGEYNSLQQSA